MRTTTIFAETHTSERANHVAYRLVILVPPTKIPPAPGTQQAATYSIAAVAGN